MGRRESSGCGDEAESRQSLDPARSVALSSPQKFARPLPTVSQLASSFVIRGGRNCDDRSARSSAVGPVRNPYRPSASCAANGRSGRERAPEATPPNVPLKGGSGRSEVPFLREDNDQVVVDAARRATFDQPSHHNHSSRRTAHPSKPLLQITHPQPQGVRDRHDQQGWQQRGHRQRHDHPDGKPYQNGP